MTCNEVRLFADWGSSSAICMSVSIASRRHIPAMYKMTADLAARALRNWLDTGASGG